jgi:hypothetical protein
VAPLTGLTSFAPGAYVIDMGQATQTVANSLRSYGMVCDLVQNQDIPVDCAITPSKSVFGADFSAGGKTYSGGSFIIEAPFAAAAQATIIKWQAEARWPIVSGRRVAPDSHPASSRARSTDPLGRGQPRRAIRA